MRTGHVSNIETMMMMMMVQMLISVTSCNVNAADNDQTTPLIMAALQGNSVICETLVRCLRPHVLLEFSLLERMTNANVIVVDN